MTKLIQVTSLKTEDPTEDVEHAPKRIRKHELAECESCPLYDQPYVPSVIPDNAKIACVGEAGGKEEARLGAPFVGPSGKLLEHALGGAGVERSEVLLTNVVSCRPPENETPTKESISRCAKRLASELIGIETIVPLGVTASSAVMGKKVGIKKERVGQPKTSKLYPDARIIPTFHPAACLRTADFFPSFITDIKKITAPPPPEWKTPQHIVVGPKKAAWVVKELLKRYDEFVLDIETAYEKEGTFVQANHYELLCVGVGFAENKVIVFDREACKDEAWRAEFKILLETTRLIAHNGKFDLSGLRRIGDGKLWFDTMLASYALDERGGIHDLGHVASEQLGAPNFKSVLKPYLGPDKSYARIPRHTLHKYNAADVSTTYVLAAHFKQRLASAGLRELHDYLIRASNVLMHVEMGGMGIDLDVLDEVDTDLKWNINRLQELLHPWLYDPTLAKQPKKVTPNSWLQVQRAIKRTTGVLTPSTDKAHIEELIENGVTANGYLQLLLEYRKVQKLWATYVNGIRQRMYDSRVHPSFLLHGTTSGRISCRNPNLQNVPR